MTAEGVFPKVGGDVIYASEINSFYSNGETIAFGSTIIMPSGNSQLLGSVVLPSTKLSNPCMVLFDGFVSGTAGLAVYGCNVRLSGLSTNVLLTGSGTDAGNGDKYLQLSAFIGSPWKGIGLMKANQVSATGHSQDVQYITNLDTTQNVIVLMYGNAVGSMCMPFYHVSVRRINI